MSARLHRALLTALLVAAAMRADAHSFPKHAEPPVGATVHFAPTAVSIDFTEPLERRFSSIEVLDPAGQHVEAGPLQADGDGRHVSVTLKPIGAGTYTVVWHATSVDTHKTEGQYRFTVEP